MHQVRLATAAFEGDSNAYLIGTGSNEPTTLIDTGICASPVERGLRDGLADRGVTFADIDRVLLTHFHHDHVGLAGTIQRASDATVYAHPADAPLIGGARTAQEARNRGFADRIDRWGVPEPAKEELTTFLQTHGDLAGPEVSVTALDPGDRFPVGDCEISVRHVPGHTAGSVAYDLGNGHLAAGDVLLPQYTPNIGGADIRVERPLSTYLESLRTFVDPEITTVWPGHRDRIDEPAARAREIRQHHRDRTARVIRVLAASGAMDVWSVSAALFGDLAGIHILHGPGEAHAHLVHLVNEGAATVEDGRYRSLDPDVDVDRIVPPL